MGRILAIDYGKKRVGIAVSDPGKIIATGSAAEFVPEHDRLCRPEGAAMLDHLSGDPAGAAMLKVSMG